jgi:hypothetical protein
MLPVEQRGRSVLPELALAPVELLGRAGLASTRLYAKVVVPLISTRVTPRNERRVQATRGLPNDIVYYYEG